jgi:hypothetical protein
METDISALQMLPEDAPEVGRWPCTVSAFDDEDEE